MFVVLATDRVYTQIFLEKWFCWCLGGGFLGCGCVFQEQTYKLCILQAHEDMTNWRGQEGYRVGGDETVRLSTTTD